MKILYYNWAPCVGQNVSGGVGVYLRNLLDYYRNTDNEIYVLSSGFYYDEDKTLKIRQDDCNGNIRMYSIINSPIVAPHPVLPASQFKEMIDNVSMVALWKQFIEENGPFDIVHLMSIEGLTPNILKLKEVFPNTKFLHSIHDYGILCPNVKLWTIDNKNCFREDRRRCSRCIMTNSAFSNRRLWLTNVNRGG